ncbi:MAG TPA: hypothetical protein VFK40_00870 [Nitrososphaeraceae archaeon]|nr:hypothetical protein [Nitrososphaeraceae archaeon]
MKEPIDWEKAEDINIDDNYVILMKKCKIISFRGTNRWSER